MPTQNLVVPETLEALVAHPRLNRANVYYDDRNLRMWVRKLTIRPVHVLLDIADMEAVRKGTGSLTRFLDVYEPLGFLVETVGNARLARYLRKRGYRPVENQPVSAPSLYRPTDLSSLDPSLRALADDLMCQRRDVYGS